MANIKKERDLEDVDKNEFKEGEVSTKVRLTQHKNGEPAGVFINTNRKFSEKFTKEHKGVWLPYGTNIISWLKKLGVTLQRLFKRQYGEELLISHSQIEEQEDKIKDLEKTLFEEKQKTEIMKSEYESYSAKLNLAKEVIENIESYERVLKIFKEFVKNSIIQNIDVEEEIKRKIKANRWLLGLDCEVKAKNVNIDNQTEIDLHIINQFGQDRIIEIKSPNKKLFKRKKDGSRLGISLELSNAMSEIIVYMDKVDFYSKIAEEGTTKISKPAGIILMDGALSKEEKNMLNNLNYHLRPHILIITYDELINNASKEISLIRGVKR